MKNKTIIIIGILLLCNSVFADYKIEAGNHTELKDSEINGFVTNLVKAINDDNQDALLSLLHPDCSKVINKNEDVSLFLKVLLSHTIPPTHKWKAIKLKEDSALFKINRFVVKPTMCVDIFWDAPTKEKSDKIDALSIMFIKQGDKLFVVSYMNDYIKKELISSNKPEAGKEK